MRRKPFRFVEATVRFETEGGLGEKLLSRCARDQIELEAVTPTATGFKGRVRARDYAALAKHARRCHCRIQVKERYGVMFWLAAYRRRAGLLAGAVAAVLLLALSQQLVWNITFLNCTQAEQQQLRTQLYEHGIYEGAYVDAQTLKYAANEMFLSTDAYSWVTLNFVHGRLVAEKVDRTQQPQALEQQYCDFVAAEDGRLTRLDVSGGFVRRREGEIVSKGEVLVSSGRVGRSGEALLSPAAAKVYAEVEKIYTCTQPLQVSAQCPTGEVQTARRLLGPWGALPLSPALREDGQGITQVTRQGVALFGLHFPATVETSTLRSIQTVQARLSKTLAAQTARMKIFDEISREFGEYTLVSSEELVDEGPDSVTVTLRVCIETDIARKAEFGGFT